MADLIKFISDNNESLSSLTLAFYLLGIEVKELDNKLLLTHNKSRMNINNDLGRKFRSVIIDKNSYQLISYPLDGKVSYETFMNNVKWKDCVIEESIDGTFIVLYYNNGKWMTGTKRTIDGNCTWHSDKTFHDLFMETAKFINFDFNRLSDKYCYSFVLCHPESRNITVYDQPMLYHVSSRNMLNYIEEDLDIGVQKPCILKLGNKNLIDCHNYEELQNRLNDLDMNKEGFMLYSLDRKFRTKLRGKEHLKLLEIKGNNFNIINKLIEVRIDIKNDKNTEFLKYFPEYTQDMLDLEFDIDSLAKKINKIYSDVKKKKLDIDIPKVYRKIIILLHNEYIKLINLYNPEIHNYKPNINYKKILHYLENNIESSYLSEMIKYIRDNK